MYPSRHTYTLEVVEMTWAATWQNQQNDFAPSTDSFAQSASESLLSAWGRKTFRPVWSESSLSAWRQLGSLATHWAHSEDSDQPGHGGCPGWSEVSLGTHILLILSCCGSLGFTVLLLGWTREPFQSLTHLKILTHNWPNNCTMYICQFNTAL